MISKTFPIDDFSATITDAMNQGSGSSHGWIAVQTALHKLIQVHNDLPPLLLENASEVNGNEIMKQLEEEANSFGVDVAVVAKSLVLAQVKQLATQPEQDMMYNRDLDGILSTIQLFVKKKVLSTTDISEHLLKENAFLDLPLISLWKFSRTGVLSLDQIVKRIHEKSTSNTSILNELYHLALHKKKDPSSTAAVSATLSVLISIAYDLGKDIYASLCKYADDILNSLTSRILDHIFDERENKLTYAQNANSIDYKEMGIRNEVGKNSSHEYFEGDAVAVLNIYELVLSNQKISPESLERYFSVQLRKVLTHRPGQKLGYVLLYQEKWRSTYVSATLTAFMKKVIGALGYEMALNILDLVISNDEVNWGCVLTLIATSLSCHQGAVTILKGMIERNIKRGFEEREMEFLIIGFLFARHCSQEGRHIFPSYENWFTSVFASEAGSPASSKQSFVFLIRYLTDLVPHEPAYCLRAHITHHIYIPYGCREVFRDYCNLARARLQDLKDSIEIHNVSPGSSRDKTKVHSDVRLQ